MKAIVTKLLGAVLMLSVVTACQRSSAPVRISKIESTPTTESAHVDEDAPRISLEDAKKDFDAGTAVFIDTRGANAFALEHIKDAINIPTKELEAKIDTIPPGKKIIAYCS